jgi:hypothetical protein
MASLIDEKKLFIGPTLQQQFQILLQQFRKVDEESRGKREGEF